MKKLLSVLLAISLLMSFGMISAFAAVGDIYDADAQFDTENADGSSVPWQYWYSSDAGATFNLMTVYTVRDWGNYWYIDDDSYDGLGYNDDVPDAFEFNVNDNNTGIAALAFVAPNAGTFKVHSFEVQVLWDQVAENFYIYKGATQLSSVALGETGATIPELVVELAEGDTLVFYAKTFGTDGDNWYSAYVSNVVIEEVAAVETPAATPTTAPVETEAPGDTSQRAIFIVLAIAATAVIVFTRKRANA